MVKKIITFFMACVILLGLIVFIPDPKPEKCAESYIKIGYVSNIADGIATVNFSNSSVCVPEEKLKIGDAVRVVIDEEGNFLFSNKIPQ